MYDLPLRTHRYLLEPVTNVSHVKLLLAKQFLGFIKQIEKSPKKLPKELLQMVKFDVRSTTGYNLRRLMLLLKKRNIENLSKEDYRLIEYNKIEAKDVWKVPFIREITDRKFNQLEVEGFTYEELEEILDFLCTS